jgi:AAA+ ATPase superfamily predicted ATPase
MTYNLQRYIPRRLATELRDSLNSFPITALLGPRQCGKSTLAKHIVRDCENTVYLDLERPSDLRKLEDAEFFFHTQRDKLIGFEFKSSVAPKVSRGFSGTLELLEPDHVWIVAPVQEAYHKSQEVTVSPIKEILDDLVHNRF